MLVNTNAKNEKSSDIYMSYDYFKVYTDEDDNDLDVKNVISLISCIGSVTLDSELAITAARAAYNELSKEKQALVTNFSTLVAAEEVLALLKENNSNQPCDSTTETPKDSTTDAPKDTTTDAPKDSTTETPKDSTTDAPDSSTAVKNQNGRVSLPVVIGAVAAFLAVGVVAAIVFIKKKK